MPNITIIDSTRSVVNTEGYAALSTEGGQTKQREGKAVTTSRADAPQRSVTTDDVALHITFTVPINGKC